MAKKNAEVFQLKDCIAVITLSSEKDTGIWSFAEPFYKLSLNFDKNLIDVIFESLSHSFERVHVETYQSLKNSLKMD